MYPDPDQDRDELPPMTLSERVNSGQSRGGAPPAAGGGAPPPAGGGTLSERVNSGQSWGGALQSVQNPEQNQGIWSDFGTDLKRGAMKLPGMVAGLADIPVALVTGENYVSQGADWLGEATGFKPSEWAEDARSEYSADRQRVQANTNQAWDTALEDGFQMHDVGGILRPYLENPVHAIGGLVAESLPSMIAGGAIGKGVMAGANAIKGIAPTLSKFLSKNAPWLGEGLVGAGMTMDALGDVEGVNQRQAALASLGAGVTTTAFGRAGGAVANRAGVGDVQQMMTHGYRQAMLDAGQELPQQMSNRFGQRMLTGGAIEGAQEIGQSASEQMWQNVGAGEELGQGVLRAGVEGFLAGNAMGMGTNAGRLGRRPLDPVDPNGTLDPTTGEVRIPFEPEPGMADQPGYNTEGTVGGLSSHTDAIARAQREKDLQDVFAKQFFDEHGQGSGVYSHEKQRELLKGEIDPEAQAQGFTYEGYQTWKRSKKAAPAGANQAAGAAGTKPSKALGEATKWIEQNDPEAAKSLYTEKGGVKSGLRYALKGLEEGTLTRNKKNGEPRAPEVQALIKWWESKNGPIDQPGQTDGQSSPTSEAIEWARQRDPDLANRLARFDSGPDGTFAKTLEQIQSGELQREGDANGRPHHPDVLQLFDWWESKRATEQQAGSDQNAPDQVPPTPETTPGDAPAATATPAAAGISDQTPTSELKLPPLPPELADDTQAGTADAAQADPAQEQAAAIEERATAAIKRVAAARPDLTGGKQLVRDNGKPNENIAKFARKAQAALAEGADPEALIEAEDARNLKPETFERRRLVIKALAADRAADQSNNPAPNQEVATDQGASAQSDVTPNLPAVANQDGTVQGAPAGQQNPLSTEIRADDHNGQAAIVSQLVQDVLNSDFTTDLGGRAGRPANPEFNKSAQAQQEGLTAEAWLSAAMSRLFIENRAGIGSETEGPKTKKATLRALVERLEEMATEAETIYDVSPIHNTRAQEKDAEGNKRTKLLSRQWVNKKLTALEKALNNEDSPLYQAWKNDTFARDTEGVAPATQARSGLLLDAADMFENTDDDMATIESMVGARAGGSFANIGNAEYANQMRDQMRDETGDKTGNRDINAASNTLTISRNTVEFAREHQRNQSLDRLKREGFVINREIKDPEEREARLKRLEEEVKAAYDAKGPIAHMLADLGREGAVEFAQLVEASRGRDAKGRLLYTEEARAELLASMYEEHRASYAAERADQGELVGPASNDKTDLDTITNTTEAPAQSQANERAAQQLLDFVLQTTEVAAPAWESVSSKDQAFIFQQLGRVADQGTPITDAIKAIATRLADTYGYQARPDAVGVPGRPDAGTTGRTTDQRQAEGDGSVRGEAPQRDAGGEARKESPAPKPTVVVKRKRRAIKAEAESVKKSQVGRIPGGTTAEAVTEAIQRALGQSGQQRLHVYQSVEDAVAAGVDRADAESSKGWVQRGKDGRWHAHFIADHIKPGRELGVFLHEVGSHLGIDALDGGDRTRLALQIKRWAMHDDGSIEHQIAKKALARVKHAQKHGDSIDYSTAISERIAYFIEEASNAGVLPQAIANPDSPLGKFLQILKEALRGVLKKFDISVEALSAQDIVDLALGMSHVAMQEDTARPGMQQAASYSRVAESIRERMGRPPANQDSPFGRRLVDHIAAARHTAVDKIMFHWMGTEQLADQFGNRIAEIKELSKLTNEMEAFSLRQIAQIQEIDRHWADLTPAENKLMSEIQRVATRVGFDPDPQSDGYKLPKNAKERALQRQWSRLAELSKPRMTKATVKARRRNKPVKQWSAQEIYRKTRDHYQADLDAAIANVEELTKATQTNDDDGVMAAREQGLMKIVTQLKERRNKPYFPLRRMGEWYTVGMSPEYAALKDKADKGQLTEALAKRMRQMEDDPKHFVVSGHDNRAKAAQHQRELAKQFGGFTYLNETKQRLRVDPSNIMPKLEEFESMLQKAGVDPGALKTLKENYESMIIASSPDNSMLRRLIERKGVHGEETNMRRVFADTAQSRAFALSRMVYARPIDDAMGRLSKRTTPKVGDTSDTHQLATSLYNTMRTRMQLAFDPQEVHGVARFLTNVSYASLLGASPAFWALNLSQVPLVTLPWLSARNGNQIGKTMYDLSSNSVKMAGLLQWSLHNEVSVDINWAKAETKLTPGEMQMLQYLRDQGQLDFTIGYDLTSVAQGRNGPLDKVVRSINAPTTATEIINRGSTALVAYNIHLKKTGDHDAAMDFAREAASTTQVNYNPVNTPPALQRLLGSKSLAAVAFQFWRYQQGMAYLVLSTLRNTKADDPQKAQEAKDTAKGLAVSLMLSSGALGLPFMSTFMGAGTLVANALQGLGDDDDREWDLERELKNAVYDIAPDIAPYLTNGVLNEITGWDVGARTGMGGLLNPFAYSRMSPGQTGRETAGEVMYSMAGAPVSNAVGMFEAMKLAADGQYDKAFEKGFPLKGMRDLMKGYNLSTEGFTRPDGTVLQLAEEFTAWEKLGQYSGFAPASKGEYYRANNAIQRRKRVVDDARSGLLDDYATAFRKGSSKAIDEVLQDVQRFNQRNPHAAISFDALIRSQKRRMQNDAMRDDRGLLMDKNTQPYAELARFAYGG